LTQKSAGKALVFDLDGTLIDSVPDLHAAIASMLGELGGRVLAQEEVRGLVGDGTRILVRRCLAAAGLSEDLVTEALPRFLVHYERAPVERTRPYPGVLEGLEGFAAQGYRLGVCTNKPQRSTEIILKGLGLDRFFGSVIGGDRLAVRKPDPAHLQAVIDELGIAAADSVMIGDHVNDLAAARGTGSAAILARYGYGTEFPDELRPDREVDHFAELPEAVTALLSLRPCLAACQS